MVEEDGSNKQRTFSSRTMFLSQCRWSYCELTLKTCSQYLCFKWFTNLFQTKEAVCWKTRKVKREVNVEWFVESRFTNPSLQVCVHLVNASVVQDYIHAWIHLLSFLQTMPSSVSCIGSTFKTIFKRVVTNCPTVCDKPVKTEARTVMLPQNKGQFPALVVGE